MPTLATAGPPSLDAWGDLARARAALARGTGRLQLEGLWGSAASLALAALLPPERPAVVAVADEPTALRTLDDLRAFAAALGRKAPGEVVLMPVPHAALWRDAGAREEDAGRAGILGRLLRGEPLWVIVPVRGLEAPLPAPGGLPAPGPGARPWRRGRPGGAGRAPPDRRLRAGGDRDGRRPVGAPGRDRRRVLPGGIAAGPARAGRRRRRVAPDVRSDHPALDRRDRDAPRPPDAGRAHRRTGPGSDDYLPADAPVAVADPALLGAGGPGGRRACGARRPPARRVRRARHRRAGRVPPRDALDRGRARPVPPSRARARRLAREGFRVRLLAPDPADGAAGSRRSCGISSTRRRSSRTCSGPEPLAVLVAGRPRRVRVPGARAGLPHRDRAVRAPPDHASPADLPARAPRSPRSRTSRRATSLSTSSTGSAGTRGS